MIIGVMLAVPIQLVLPSLVYAKYDRSGLDMLANYRFGDMTFDDVQVDELMIPAYEYNSN